MPSYNNTQK